MSKWTLMPGNTGRDGAKGRLILDPYSILRAVLLTALVLLNIWFTKMDDTLFRLSARLYLWVVPFLFGVIWNLKGLVEAIRFRRVRIDIGCCVGFICTLILFLIDRYRSTLLNAYCMFAFLFGIVKGAEDGGPPRRVLR